MERPRIPLWILPLIFILTIWNPATLALQAASIVWNIGTRSTLSLVFLAARLVITSVGVAAGIALWLRRPGAVWLAKLSLMLFGHRSGRETVEPRRPGQRAAGHAAAARDLHHPAQRARGTCISNISVASARLMA